MRKIPKRFKKVTILQIYTMDWSKRLTPGKRIWSLEGILSHFDEVEITPVSAGKYTAELESEIQLPDYLRKYISENPEKVIQRIARKVTPNSPAAGITGTGAGLATAAAIGFGPFGIIAGGILGAYGLNRAYAKAPALPVSRHGNWITATYAIQEKEGLTGYKAWKQGYNIAYGKLRPKSAKGKNLKQGFWRNLYTKMRSAWHASENIPATNYVNRELQIGVNTNNGSVVVRYETPNPVYASVIKKDANRMLYGIKSATRGERFKYAVDPYWQSNGLVAKLKKDRANYVAQQAAKQKAKTST